jgi:hypothetical protein
VQKIHKNKSKAKSNILTAVVEFSIDKKISIIKYTTKYLGIEPMLTD